MTVKEKNVTQPILVVNCGSSSVKLAIYSTFQTISESTSPSITALGERLGSDNASLIISGDVIFSTSGTLDHKAALETFLEKTKHHLGNLKGMLFTAVKFSTKAFY